MYTDMKREERICIDKFDVDQTYIELIYLFKELKEEDKHKINNSIKSLLSVP